jgi:hypothetical protein
MATEDERDMRAACAHKAREMWAKFTETEKALVRFGLFPAEKMLAAEQEGHDGRLLAVALMDWRTGTAG